MKKTQLIIGISILLSSCGNHSDESLEEKNTTNQLIGVWHRYKTVVFSGKDNTILQSYEHSKCEKESIHEFKNNNKYYLTTFVMNFSTNQCKQSGTIEQLPYIYNPTTKLLDIDGEKYYLNKLTNQDMELQEYDYYDQNGDGQKDKKIDYYRK